MSMKNIMKIVLCWCFVLLAEVPVFAAGNQTAGNQKVYDNAGLLTQQQASDLNEKMQMMTE